jgi:hypothetical protein
VSNEDGSGPGSGATRIERVPRGLRRLAGRALHLYFRLRRGHDAWRPRRRAERGRRGPAGAPHLYARLAYARRGVEPNETLHDALAKELREEANIMLTGPAVLHGIFLNRHASTRDHVAVFIVRAFAQSAPKQPDIEIAEARFFPLSALPDGTTPGTRRRLAEITEGDRTTGRVVSPISAPAAFGAARRPCG